MAVPRYGRLRKSADKSLTQWSYYENFRRTPGRACTAGMKAEVHNAEKLIENDGSFFGLQRYGVAW